jgi:hypothetical protein
MDDSDAARTKQLIWELVSPLFDRLDALQHEMKELQRRVQACEAAVKSAPGSAVPLMLPAPERADDAR